MDAAGATSPPRGPNQAEAGAAARRDAELGRLLERLNPESLVVATSQRVILMRQLAAHGLATAAVHGAVGRAGGWDAASGRPVLGADATALFLAGLRDDLVIVPSAGSAERDLLVTRADPPAPSGADAHRALAQALLADPVHELFVVLGRPEVHEGVRALAGDGPLVAVRITTLATDDGEIRIVHAVLRSLPVGATASPPLRVDPDAGVPDGAGDAPALPGWASARLLVGRAAGLLLPQRSVGWDVALTPDGPVIVDAVSRYGWVEGVGFEGLLAELRGAAGSAAGDGSPA